MTPIQELFKMLDEHYLFRCSNQDEWEDKEKEFAKQCFEAGRKHQAAPQSIRIILKNSTNK